MLITTRFGGRCSSCQETIPAGAKVDWDKRSRCIRHTPSCPTKQPSNMNEAIPPGTGTCELTGHSSLGCTGWTPGQLVPNSPRRIAAGERPYLYVMQAYKKHREDGSLVFQAVCRFATDTEAERYLLANVSFLPPGIPVPAVTIC
jgi:hypothetical protein